MPEFAGFQSITLDHVKVNYLADGGGIVDPLALYPASTHEAWQQYAHLLTEEGKFITSIGAFLIELDDRIVAVDTGIGPVTVEFPGFGPFTGGKYLDCLSRTRIDRTDVTDVMFTHLHLDHVGWTTMEMNKQRQLTFPNARHMVTKAEWDFWYGDNNPAGPHPEFVQAPLADRIHFIADGDEPVPGITVIATPGHTPGHISLRITAGEQKLYLTGDLLHGPMQLQEPAWSVAFDLDAEQARASREAMYGRLTQPDTIVAVNHFSNKVFGRIQAGENGRLHWQPLA